VESMVGHRTRAAQTAPENWHQAEDATLGDYFTRSRAIDNTGAWLVAAIPRGWLIAGLLWLVPSAMSGASAGPALAIKLGGVLLAFTALKKLTASSVEVVSALIAGRRIAPLFQAAAKPEPMGQVLGESRHSNPGDKILEADRVGFRYRNGGAPALYPSSLTVRRGEKILLEGSSGGGKTTFASLLSGMRKPGSGLLLLNGLDSHTTGPQRWRQKVAAAPQFHENYILTETLAFNLLLGRQWPPSQQDMEEAEEVCRQLGLGDLLDRMPGGIEQMVGEGGWQLSHGERSRIYVARALLQNADLVILDESFGALDPENLKTSLECTLATAETLLVIAHP
jgi:ATP-binding cassette subfamily B protein